MGIHKGEMMKSLMLALLVGLAIAAPFPAANTRKPKSLQEKVLSMQATGHFPCRVNEVQVKTENPGDSGLVAVSHVRAAFQSVATPDVFLGDGRPQPGEGTGNSWWRHGRVHSGCDGVRCRFQGRSRPEDCG